MTEAVASQLAPNLTPENYETNFSRLVLGSLKAGREPSAG